MKLRAAMSVALSILMGVTLAVAPSSAASAEPAADSTTEKSPIPNPDILPDTAHETTTYRIPLKLTRDDGKEDEITAAYPNYCGLAVILSRSGTRLTSSMTTSCSSLVASIEHDLYFYRSRFFGWEKLRAVEDDIVTRSYSNGTSIVYDCSGTGTHDFQAVGYGYVFASGRSYSASAYDQIDNVSC